MVLAKCPGTSPVSGKWSVFLHILVAMSSLKMTISCVQYCTLAGLVRKRALGTSLARSAVRAEGRGGRGKMFGEPGSAGPGTKKNCEPVTSCGNSAIISPSSLRCSFSLAE